MKYHEISCMALDSRVSPACGALLQADSAKHCSVSTSIQGGFGMLAQTVRITRLGHRSAKPLEEEGIEGGEGGEERRVGSAWVCVTWDAWAAGVVRHAMARPPGVCKPRRRGSEQCSLMHAAVRPVGTSICLDRRWILPRSSQSATYKN